MCLKRDNLDHLIDPLLDELYDILSEEAKAKETIHLLSSVIDFFSYLLSCQEAVPYDKIKIALSRLASARMMLDVLREEPTARLKRIDLIIDSIVTCFSSNYIYYFNQHTLEM